MTKQMKIIKGLNKTSSIQKLAKKAKTNDKVVRNVLREYVRSANTKKEAILRGINVGFKKIRIAKLTGISLKYVNEIAKA